MSSRSSEGAPYFSIVTPVYQTPVKVLRETIESVIAQTFGDWELILVDDCSPDPLVRETLREYAAKDTRIRAIEREQNGHIVAASNDGVQAARGEFIALLDHDDLLTPEALARNAAEIAKYADVDYLYSDEDKIDPAGKRFAPFRKPVWSPERLRSQNYCTHFSVARTSLIREVGGFREGLDGSQDHDLILRVTERARRVVHIPEILYHWRVIPGSAAGDPGAKPYAREAGRRAVTDQLERLGIRGSVGLGLPGSYTVSRELPSERRVSLVIATDFASGKVWGRDRVFVLEAVRSALARTRHEQIEVVVAYAEPAPQSVIDQLAEIAGPRLVLVPLSASWPPTARLNLAVLLSSGDRIVLLEQDTQVRSESWLEQLVAPLEERGVGTTGAKLFYGDSTIRHAGIACTAGGYHHPYRGAVEAHVGVHGELLINREVSAMSRGCLAVRRDVFIELGGFTEQLGEQVADIDFGLKAAVAGLRNLFMAGCHVYQFEQRPATNADRLAIRDLRKRWGYPSHDPYMPAFAAPAPPVPARLRLLQAERASRG